jgi:hypothetical protein
MRRFDRDIARTQHHGVGVNGQVQRRTGATFGRFRFPPVLLA